MECQHQKRDCEQVSEGHPSLANSSLPLELLNRDTVVHKFHLEKTNKRKQPPETTCGDGSVPWQSIQGMSGNTRTVCDKKELPAHSSQHLTVPVTMAKSVQTQTTIPTKCSADVAVGTSGIEDRDLSKSTQTSPAAVKMHRRTEAIHLGDVQDSGSHMEDSRGVPNVDRSTGFATLDCSQVDRVENNRPTDCGGLRSVAAGCTAVMQGDSASPRNQRVDVKSTWRKISSKSTQADIWTLQSFCCSQFEDAEDCHDASMPSKGNGPCLSDTTADRILERIEQGTSDLDISNSDEDSIGDIFTPSVPLEDSSSEDKESSDEDTHLDSEKTQMPYRPNTSSIGLFQPFVDSQNGREWSPYDYFKEYVPDELFCTMAAAMNTCHIVQTGKSLKTSGEELKIFFGISITMSCLGYPQIRMYWQKRTRVPIIADKMRKNRYFQLRLRLKVVNELDMHQEKKEKDKLWRIRPFVSKIWNGCLQLPREECLIINEQVIPFSGRTQLKQLIPRTTNPEGLRNFVLATPDGLILDFEIYVGKKSTLFQGSSGITESAVLRLSNSLTSGTKLFFDRYFTSSPLLDKLAEKGIFGTGLLMDNRVPKCVKFSSESALKAKGKGTSEMMVRDDGKQILVRWYDNKAVTLMSSIHGKQAEDSCLKSYFKEKKHVGVAMPNIVQLYNSNMRRVDMACRMISRYRMKARVKKWTIRCFFHLIDMALSNSWLLYRRDMCSQQKRAKDILKFRLSVGEALMTKAEEATAKSDSDTDGQPATKQASVPPLQATLKGIDHLPRLADVPNASRCRMKGCNMKTKFFCVKCKLFYCITKERRCFEKVHSLPTIHPSSS
ncbi:piggyBac transposable element-derived protein 3-like isoform X2 [Dermacentor albipictus]|uniref:piggyBac transposable element-derived protein 3-like isoform X2 n=1 Tax=Dermacentor albipictus TaxID=60249 RepID=UPI0038FCC3F2